MLCINTTILINYFLIIFLTELNSTIKIEINYINYVMIYIIEKNSVLLIENRDWISSLK
jgi:hypothetical protein